MGSFFVQKTKSLISKKMNSGLVSVWFFTQKDPLMLSLISRPTYIHPRGNTEKKCLNAPPLNFEILGQQN